tara:strand:- start:1566 stop:1745 length:180 start_codon:yes stop_codon:yes gene_type:complete
MKFEIENPTTMSRYTVYLYHGGERPNEKLQTKCIETAKLWVQSSEHGLIEDSLNARIIE